MPDTSESTSSFLRSVDEFLAVDHDYIIVGGGTAGLALAARLSEDPKVKVGVLEAGSAHLNDQSLLTPAAFGSIIESPEYDWELSTVPQEGTHNIRHSFPRGKGLGGSSAINYMQYVRGQRAEYSDWGKLTGYSGWGWEDLQPYFIKHEGFNGPASSLEDPHYHDDEQLYYQLERQNHGDSGPIRTSFPTWGAPIEKDWHRAAKKLDIGFGVPQDAWNGHSMGGYSNLSTIDRTNGSGTRSYATTGYLLPSKDRSNLSVLVNAQVARITLVRDPDLSLRATGATFVKAGKQHSVTAALEVILTAGVVHSPQLLEISGIGSRSRLESLGIECLVENDQVGEGLEDHVCAGITYEIDKGVFTNDWMSRDEVIKKASEEYQGGKGGILANPVGNTAFLSLSQIATEQELAAVRLAIEQEFEEEPSKVTLAQRDLLVKQLLDPGTASFQMTMLPGGVDSSKQHTQKEVFMSGINAISVMVVTTHPFSRGSIHVVSNDINTAPNIDPQYLQHSLDSVVLAIGLRVANDILNTSPLKEQLVRRIFPSKEVDMTDMAAVNDFIHKHAITSYHPIGTVALGQVVDDRLKVKGVNGLRVVDASVFPLHISGNIVGSVYAVAEKAADMIKEDARM